MWRMKAETKVGMLFIVGLIAVAAFAYYLGVLNPFSRQKDLYLGFNFAGGIEVGSPVRVMGIKVGKVSEIKFDPDYRDTNTGEEVKLRVKIEINRDAWPTVRKDSKFFINLAGVIGEKFIEITPGSHSSEELQAGDFRRGEDPPRIDQLISQSYGLAGKILDMVNKNEGSISDTLDKMNSLVSNLNKTLTLLEKTSKNKEVNRVIGNLAQMTDDMTILTSKLRGPEAEKTMTLLHDLLWRLNKVDEQSIHNFFQKEGIKAHIF
jgi:phospholipid/cholesterol/gamma-HCH transport system substrate-binding protein